MQFTCLFDAFILSVLSFIVAIHLSCTFAGALLGFFALHALHCIVHRIGSKLLL